MVPCNLSCNLAYSSTSIWIYILKARPIRRSPELPKTVGALSILCQKQKLHQDYFSEAVCGEPWARIKLKETWNPRRGMQKQGKLPVSSEYRWQIFVEVNQGVH